MLSAVLLILSLQSWDTDELQTPALTRADVRTDTVWFRTSVDRIPPPADTFAYGRALDGGDWVRRSGVAPGPNPSRFPAKSFRTRTARPRGEAVSGGAKTTENQCP